MVGNHTADEETDKSIVGIDFGLDDVHPLIYESGLFRGSTEKISVGLEASN